MKNQFGLPRAIPPSIALEVRKNCGFGCVICGSAFYHYDHYQPEFNEAKEHNAKGITLLCAEHHDAKTRGRISTESVITASINPRCKQDGFSYGPLEFGTKSSVIQIGTTLFLESKNIICINGESVLSIRPPEVDNGPFLLTLVTEDTHSSNRIVDNEWIGDANSWDITTVGRKIIVKDRNRLIILEIENIPGDKFIIHQINISYRSFKIVSKNISKKVIDSVLITEEKIITIINPLGREIARIGNNGENLNEIKWENALEVVGNYMIASLENINLKGGNINILTNPKTPVSLIGNTFTSVKLNLGIDKKVKDFIEDAKRLIKDLKKVNGNKQCIDPKRRIKFKNQYRLLHHTFLINQLTVEDKSFIADFIRKI